MKTVFFASLLFLSTVSIGGTTLLSPSPAQVAEASFTGQRVATLGNADSLRIQPNRISGTGTVVFSDSLSNLGANSSHALSIALQEGGSLTFSVYASNNLSDGLDFQFSRTGKQLKVMLSQAGIGSRDISSSFSTLDASRVVDLQIDIHNSENPAHVLVWNGIERDFSEDTALINSAEGNASPGQGRGLMRGFVLRNADLLKAIASPAKFHHEH